MLIGTLIVSQSSMSVYYFGYILISPELRERFKAQKNGGQGKGRRPEVVDGLMHPLHNPCHVTIVFYYGSHLEHPRWYPSVLIIFGRSDQIARGKLALKTERWWAKHPISYHLQANEDAVGVLSVHMQRDLVLTSESRGVGLNSSIWKSVVCQTPSNKGFVRPQNV